MASPSLNTNSGFNSLSSNTGVTVQHDAGQLFGHVLNALPGYSTLGSNITNPNVNYQGATNPGTPSNNYSTTPKVLGTSTANSGGSSSAINPGGSLGSVPALNYTQAQLQGYNSGLGAINTTAGNSFNSLYDNLMSSANAIGANDQSTQLGIDQGRENNQLNRLNGIQDILGYVRSGLQSGGAQLANMNAGDSSATGALARAYSTLGNQQTRDINNQSALTDRGLDTQQQQLGIQNQSSQDQLKSYRDSQVQNISTDIAQRLAALDQQAAGLDLPGKVDINQQKQQLIDQGNAQVGQIDSYLQNLLGGIAPEAADKVLANASNLRTAGAAASNPFSTNLPDAGLTALQGPALDQLPILVNPTKTKQTV